jgi:hypothetical protein
MTRKEELKAELKKAGVIDDLGNTRYGEMRRKFDQIIDIRKNPEDILAELNQTKDHPFDEKGKYFFTELKICEYTTEKSSKYVMWEWNSCDGFFFYSKSTGKKLKRISKEAKSAIIEELKELITQSGPWLIEKMNIKGFLDNPRGNS